jgi:polar amino acid transport system permease protein
LLNDLVALQKDVGLISILGVVDAVRMAQIESARTFNYTPYLVAGLLFVLLAVPTVRLADWVNARATRRQQAGDAW